LYQIVRLMKKIFLIISVLWSVFVFGQIEDAWVYFNDKPEADFYLNNPLEMLSQKALDRRTNQNIAVDYTDVPIHQPYIDALNNTGTVIVLAKSKWMNAVHIQGTFSSISDLVNFSFVESIQYANKALNNSAKPNLNSKKHYPNQKNLNLAENFAYGNSDNQIEIHNGHLLHQEGFTGTGKIIAVLDNGFIGVNTALPFERLHNENLILGGYDFVNRSDDFYNGGNHGTRVLSVIGAYQENELIGTAPNASFYLFITEDNNSETPLEESLWVEAAETADSLGVDIINTSLGYATFDNPDYNYTYSDMDGITTFISKGLNFAYSKGIICITSAGNYGNASWQYITSPADALGAFSVGAVNNIGEYASFSSIGPTADNRIKPDVVAQGVASVNALPNGAINTSNGTSFSAPIIAGLTACLWEAFPDLNNEQLMQLIRESAHLYENPTFQLGYGIPDFYQAYQNLNKENPDKNIFVLYPNPASDQLYIYNNSLNENNYIRLFDISGKQVLEQSFQNNSSIDLKNLEVGLYIYKVLIGREVKTGKILKK